METVDQDQEKHVMKCSISRRRLLAGAASAGAGALVFPRISAGSYRANEQVGIAVAGVSGRGSWFDRLEPF